MKTAMQEAEEYAKKIHPYKFPLNKNGEEYIMRVGQVNPPNWRKYLAELKKISDAYLAGYHAANEWIAVINEVVEERKKQDAKWGEQNHSPANWLMILTEEVGEVSKAAVEAHFGNATLEEYRNELIQVAAVAIAMIECHDRNNPPITPPNKDK